jgi:hypothetical protein
MPYEQLATSLGNLQRREAGVIREGQEGQGSATSRLPMAAARAPSRFGNRDATKMLIRWSLCLSSVPPEIMLSLSVVALLDISLFG